MQVVAGDLLQQDVEAIASALGRDPAGVGNHQTPPLGPLHALASWFGAAFRQTSNDLGVSSPTQRQQQHHLLAVGPPYTGKHWHCLLLASGKGKKGVVALHTNTRTMSRMYTLLHVCMQLLQHLCSQVTSVTAQLCDLLSGKEESKKQTVTCVSGRDLE